MLNGHLYGQDFLLEGVKNLPEWQAIAESEIEGLRNQLLKIYQPFIKSQKPNERATEDDCIFPIIKILGWEYLPAQSADQHRKDIPDALLFANSADKAKANAQDNSFKRYRHGLVILENKARDINLDRAAGRDEAPSTQILRYLTTAEIQSKRNILWGFLTNGRIWRLYYTLARSRSEDFLELDLPAVLGLRGHESLFFKPELQEHWLKVFLLMFRRQSFLSIGLESKTFHQAALAEGELWEAKVAQSLSALVFEHIFPRLVTAIINGDKNKPKQLDRKYCDEVKQAALILLYRLLFVLYAEDRDLLPVTEKRYDEYGMRHRVRQDIAKRRDNKDEFSDRQDDYYHHLKGLFEIIAEGDEKLGVPPYNGGLFDSTHTKILDRCRLPDSIVAEIIDMLSRREERGRMVYINYRDLSVQQLGSIYERLLEFDVTEADGQITVQPNVFARKGSGSYYTPEELVRLIIERTLEPLIAEREKVFETALKKFSRNPNERDKQQLKTLDPASTILDLKICDPAMGSGHFLVSLVDYLADRILEAMSVAEAAGTDIIYQSPLKARLHAIRKHIQDEAKTHKWLVNESQLEDRMLIRRMILKRVIYGVDKNPMAVELAKVSLWLHTFTVGAPLSFLDHHLRCGDSLFGEWVRPFMDEFADRGSLLLHQKIQEAKSSATEMQQVEDLTDADIAEVHKSSDTFSDISARTAPLNKLLTMIHALKWADNGTPANRHAIESFYVGLYGDPLDVLMNDKRAIIPKGSGEQPTEAEKKTAAGKKRFAAQEAGKLFPELLAKAIRLAEEQRFLNWQIAFPNVWTKWESVVPEGGFDAIIGNPPWDRIKLQEVEWFAIRKPEIARQARASDRKKMIAALEKRNDPLIQGYQYAAAMAEAASRVARLKHGNLPGDYPLLSGGDINLYSLFVERAAHLINSKGIVGLLVPSGIAADLGASEFFKSIATTGRLAALIDFENRRGRGHQDFFPDVDSRFKFCVFVFSGKERKFPATDCAFFIHNLEDLKDDERTFQLTADDFSAVNPNTGTAPIFRTQKDAELTKRIYKKFPVLVRHEADPANPGRVIEQKLYPVSYYTMLHMTNDAGKFKKRAELEADGFYRVDGNRLKKGNDEFVPLYVGKMIWHYDHRASSVTVNEENINVATSSENTTSEQHQNPAYYPTPQFWVSSKEITWPENLSWLIGFRDISNATNERTLIANVIPYAATGNTLPLLLPENDIEIYKQNAACLLANLNSLCLDFIVRQKAQGTHLNWYLVEQLPIISSQTYQTKLGKKTAAQIIKDEILRLCYTADDLESFARDMGYDGKPFRWDEDDRRHRKARLDALYFLLYGLSREEASCVLGTFPIVQRNDEAEFGRYLTRDLILGYMAAFAAGDTDTKIAI